MHPTPSSVGDPRAVVIDPSFGVAGDMLLAALVDAGASEQMVRTCVEAVIPDTVRITWQQAERSSFAGLAAHVEPTVEDHPHRSWAVIRGLLDAASLPERVRERALAVFGVLAEAEGAVHGVPADTVHFHEVGAWDSIADVVGVVAALESLNVDRVEVLPLAVGAGTVRAAHGLMPVPPPAVAELLTRTDVSWSALPPGGEGIPGELATPTGVALLVALGVPASGSGHRLERVGVGVGTKDFPNWPNVVRVMLCRPHEATESRAVHGERRTMTVYETNLDDLDPRAWPSVLRALLAAGANDAWLTPYLGKKGRSGQVLHVLADPSAEAGTDLLSAVFDLTGTLGVRQYEVMRTSMDRGWVRVTLPGTTEVQVRVKYGARDGRVVHATPEYEDCASAGERMALPVVDVLELARAAAVQAGVVRGALVRELPDDA